MQKYAGEQSGGVCHYARHVGLVTCIAVVLAATGRGSHGLGVVASFGFYGALHASMIAVTLRLPQSPWRKLMFVAIGASLSMLAVSLSLYASRFVGRSPGTTGPALLLALSSGFGAASYSTLIRRFFRAHLTPPELVSITLGCVVATLAVLASGIYLKSGVLSFALAWWFAMSLGLWFYDGRRSQRRA